MSRKNEPAIELELTPSGRIASPNEQGQQAIRQQLARVLESAPFRTSKRCPALLGYVVEKALRGDTEGLKERSLGIDVFHRDPQYDTNADPVVRIAAGEVRKKLAQYYYDASHKDEIRIELPPGSYVAEFYKPEVVPATELERDQPSQNSNSNEAQGIAGDLAAQGAADASRPSRRPLHILLPVLCLVLGSIAGAFAMRMHGSAASAPPTALEDFWRPLISAPGTVWLCVGESYVTRIELDPNGARNRFASSYRLSSGERRAYPALNMADSIVLANVAALLKSQNKKYSVNGETETAFSDLSSGPSVLIGSFNNDWTIRLSDQLRFHFEMDRDSGEQWIVDREKPGDKIGTHFFNLDVPDTKDAYAIISRVRDASTGQMVVALAGVSANGTSAAGTFVSAPEYLDEFAKHAPRDWQNANLQIVIAAPIVDGSLGPPHIVNSYVW